jgi:tRNA threonylcarbamoyl adenosine modification protein YeaZ
MLALAIDTSFGACAVAVVDAVDAGTGAEPRLLASQRQLMARGHAEALMGMIEQVMAASSHPIGEVGRICVTAGPGTFTGLRVGLATARGLALAIGCPAVGVGTLEAMALDVAEAGLNDAEPFAVALDARRGEVYVQAFDGAGAALSEAMVASPAAASGALPARVIRCFGSGAELVAAASSDAVLQIAQLPHPEGPSPLSVARLGLASKVSDTPPVPRYLRPPDAKPQQGAAVARR